MIKTCPRVWPIVQIRIATVCDSKFQFKLKLKRMFNSLLIRVNNYLLPIGVLIANKENLKSRNIQIACWSVERR